MNTSYRPQSRLMYQMPVDAPAPPAMGHSAPKSGTLSARQLLDIELGLYLLSQLLPAAPPDALPDLLTNRYPAALKRTQWTARQHRYLNRARLLLTHFCDRNCWLGQIERYATGATHQPAYVVNGDRTRFEEKTVGFSRNRLVALRQMLG